MQGTVSIRSENSVLQVKVASAFIKISFWEKPKKLSELSQEDEVKIDVIRS
jgi:hypothetical protein